MNDQIGTTQVQTPTQGTRRTAPRRWVAFALSLVAVAATLTMPVPAAAAGSAVKGCFVYTSTNRAAPNAPVTLQRWNGSAWVNVVSGRTGSGGCGTFSGTRTTSGTYYRMHLHYVVGTECGAGIWMANGYTGFKQAGASGTVNLGSWYATDGWIC